MTAEIQVSDVLHAIDRAVIDASRERVGVFQGQVYNPSHPNPIEYMYFLQAAEKAFRGLRATLRSEEFLKQVAENRNKRGPKNEDQ